jgi:DNA polymerase-3 subunit epsilon|tara:strand:+ start:11795 stop:13063 length:1269 start_codon:yes stop_codon:yes gene_type:complete
VVDKFISLINPEKSIQPFVVNLTGINNKMLRNAPKFHEVAKRILEITEDTIFVAHNTSFDFRILKTEYSRLGYNFKRNTLCTLELSKKLIPDMNSYSLGKLTKQLGIPLTQRHRASGDALATVKLFKLLLDKDLEKKIIIENIKNSNKNSLPKKLNQILDNLPNSVGIYYMHDENSKIIYIGKSKNIKKRINQHFAGKDNKSKKLQLHTETVSYDETGSELIALLKESNQIKLHKPIYNRKLRKSVYPYGLYSYNDENNYINLKISKINTSSKPITTFKNINAGIEFLNKLINEYNLCQKLCGIYKSKNSCFKYSIKECSGACINLEKYKDYNLRILKAIKYLNFDKQNFAIIDKGRNIDENSFILVEDGLFIGLGYFNLNFQINNIDVLKTILIKMDQNKDNQLIIQSFLKKSKKVKLLQY